MDRRAPPTRPLHDQRVPRLLAAEELAGGHGPAQEEVGVVLPGEPDTAVDLHAPLGAGGVGVTGESAGDGHGDGDLVLVAAPHGVPGGGPGQLERAEHVRTAVLDRLVLADRPAELLAVLGVGRRGVHTPGRPAQSTPPPAGWRPGRARTRAGARRPGGDPSARRRGGPWPGAGSGPGSCAPRPPDPSAGTTDQPSSMGTTTTPAVTAPSTAVHSSTAGSEAKATAPGDEPSTSPGRYAARASSSPSRSITAAASTVGTIGPGAQARPSSSSTTANSVSP